MKRNKYSWGPLVVLTIISALGILNLSSSGEGATTSKILYRPFIYSLAKHPDCDGRYYLLTYNGRCMQKVNLSGVPTNLRRLVEATVPIAPGGRNIVYSLDGTIGYVFCWEPPEPPYATRGSIAVVNTVNDELDTILVIGSNHGGGVITPDGQYLYTPNYYLSNVFKIATSDYSITKTIDLQTSWPGQIVITPDGSYVIVIGGQDGTCDSHDNDYLCIINTSNDSLEHKIQLPHEGAQLSITPDGSSVYITTRRNCDYPFEQMAYEIDLRTNPPAIVDSILIGYLTNGDKVAGAGIALGDGFGAITVGWEIDSVYIFETHHHGKGHNVITDRISVGNDPEGLLITGDTLFVLCHGPWGEDPGAENDQDESIWIITDIDTTQEAAYWEDFHNDPGWITNDSTNFYWNEADENYALYHLQGEVNGEEWAYIPINLPNDKSFELVYDLLVESHMWATSLMLGLYDSSFYRWYGPGISFCEGRLNHADPGRQIVVHLSEEGEYSESESLSDDWAAGVWYKISLKYNRNLHTATMILQEKSSGDTLRMVSTEVLSGMGLMDIDRLGKTNVPTVDCGPGREARGYVDNIELYLVIPPSAPILTGYLSKSPNKSSSGDVFLDWENVPMASHYEVYRDTVSSFFSGPTTFLGSTSESEYLDAGVVGNTAMNYYYIVKSVEERGFKSVDSNTVGEFDELLESIP